VNPGFCEEWKLLPYHLEDLRTPQVGNPCAKAVSCSPPYSLDWSIVFSLIIIEHYSGHQRSFVKSEWT